MGYLASSSVTVRDGRRHSPQHPDERQTTVPSDTRLSTGSDHSATDVAHATNETPPDAGSRPWQPMESEFRAAVALTQSLFDRTESELVHPSIAGSPEALANAQTPYIRGMADVLPLLPEEHVMAVRTQLRTELCDGHPTEAQQLVAARLMSEAPSIADHAALDCILGQQQAEGLVIVAVAEAWRIAGFSPTENWTNWRDSAQAPQVAGAFTGGPNRPGRE